MDVIAYNPDMGTDKAKLLVYMDPSYKEGLKHLAATQARSMSNLIEWLVIQAVDEAREKGVIPPASGEETSGD